MNILIISFVAGIVFALGLGIGGMTQPAKVTAFLDFTGNWDPSLAFVMMGAIGVHAVLYRVIRARPSPVFAAAFSIPARKDIDPRLIGGAALFGLGWGLGGFCPGPALTAVASGKSSVLIFVGAMVGGMLLHKWITTPTRHTATPGVGPEAIIDV